MHLGETQWTPTPGSSFQRLHRSNLDPVKVFTPRIATDSNVQDNLAPSKTAQNGFRDTKMWSVEISSVRGPEWDIQYPNKAQSDVFIWITLNNNHNNNGQTFHVRAAARPLARLYPRPLARILLTYGKSFYTTVRGSGIGLHIRGKLLEASGVLQNNVNMICWR